MFSPSSLLKVSHTNQALLDHSFNTVKPFLHSENLNMSNGLIYDILPGYGIIAYSFSASVITAMVQLQQISLPLITILKTMPLNAS